MNNASRKLMTYRQTLKAFSENEDFKDIEDKMLLRENLAYFIEHYMDKEEWEELYSTIINGLRENNANEVCHLMYYKIRSKWLLDISKIKSKEK